MCGRTKEFILIKSLAYMLIENNTTLWKVPPLKNFCYAYTEKIRELTKVGDN